MKAYLISVISAAIVCAIVNAIFRKNAGSGAVIRFLSGIMLSIVAINPILSISWEDIDIESYINDYDPDRFIAEGEEANAQARKEIIKDTAETYIQNKAQEYGCDIDAEVELLNESPYIPATVTIRGSVSPYVKAKVGEWIVDNLAVPTEDQSWIG